MVQHRLANHFFLRADKSNVGNRNRFSLVKHLLDFPHGVLDFNFCKTFRIGSSMGLFAIHRVHGYCNSYWSVVS